MSIDRMDRFIRELEAIKYYDSTRQRKRELELVVASLNLSLAECQKEREELKAAIPNVPTNKQMWKSMIEDTLKQLARPEPRSFHPLAVELGIPEMISTFIQNQVNLKVDEMFHVRLKEEFTAQTLDAIDRLVKNQVKDQQGGWTEQKVNELKLKAYANPLQALHGKWDLNCSFCKERRYATLDDQKIRDLLRNSYIEEDHLSFSCAPLKHKAQVTLAEILRNYLIQKS